MASQAALELLIVVKKGQCRLLRCWRTKPVSGWSLRRPFLHNQTSLAPYRPGDAELVVRLLDKKKVPLGQFGWTARSHRWIDVLPPNQIPAETLKVLRRLHRPTDIRTLRVPVDRRSVYLELSRRTVESSGAATHVVTSGLTVYEIVWRSGVSETVRKGKIRAVREAPSPILLQVEPRHGRAGSDSTISSRIGDLVGPEGSLLGRKGTPSWMKKRPLKGRRKRDERQPAPKPLDGTRASGKGFDIVITGDGFTKNEQSSLRYQARRLRNQLRRIEPFRGHARSIRWHIVPAVSKDSGVEVRPEYEPDPLAAIFQRSSATPGAPNKGFTTGSRTYGRWPKRTYYEIFCVDSNKEEGVTPAGYAPARPMPFLRGTSQVGSWGLIDLVIVIVNYRGGSLAGHAWPDMKLVAIPIVRFTKGFAQLAAHEAAHVIGGLVDEYPNSVDEDPLDPAPNLAALADVATSVRNKLERTYNGRFGRGGWPKWKKTPPDRVWWLTLRKPRLKKGTPLSAVHLPGDRWPPQGQVATGVPFERAVGAFWGCEMVKDWDRTRGLATFIAEQLRNQAGSVPTTASLSKTILDTQFGEDRTLMSEGKLSAYLERLKGQWSLRGMFHYRAMCDCRMRRVPKGFCKVCNKVLSEVIERKCSHRGWAQPPQRVGFQGLP